MSPRSSELPDLPSAAEQGIVTGKIFEAVGLGTPILLIAPTGSDAEDIVAATGAGACFCGTDTAEIARFLVASLSRPVAVAAKTNRFNWRVLAEEMDQILENSITEPAVARTS